MPRDWTFYSQFWFQRLNELRRIRAQKELEPVNLKTCDEVFKNADFTLSFLDDFVSDELEKGSQPYRNESVAICQSAFSKGKRHRSSELNTSPLSGLMRFLLSQHMEFNFLNTLRLQIILFQSVLVLILESNMFSLSTEIVQDASRVI